MIDIERYPPEERRLIALPLNTAIIQHDLENYQARWRAVKAVITQEELDSALCFMAMSKGVLDLSQGINYVRDGWLEPMRQLLESGANPNWKIPPAEWRALHHATTQRNRKAICLLLDAGADVNAQTSFGHTALHEAIDTAQESIDRSEDYVDDLQRSVGCQPGDLYEVDREAKYGVVLDLLRAGARVDIADDQGNTPLDCAGRDREIIERMVKKVLYEPAD